MSIWTDFIDLFFPSLCVSCDQRLIDQEHLICINCIYSLPRTNHLQNRENKLKELFHGRFPLQNAASYSYFSKGGCIQKIVHEIKYKNNKPLGIYIGHLCGNTLINADFIKTIDCIIPVPIHPNRLKKRGYNQALLIAKGISEQTGIPVIEDILIRIKDNVSQTSKSKGERWINTENIFDLEDQNALDGKHVLLIDDIVTTGSTLEACANKICSCKNTKLSIYTFGSTL